MSFVVLPEAHNVFAKVPEAYLAFEQSIADECAEGYISFPRSERAVVV